MASAVNCIRQNDNCAYRDSKNEELFYFSNSKDTETRNHC